ncbi:MULTISPECIES: hypothetical protein [unclassified Enterococcus]|uniref:hypothetical protein n=1 Tax=unclassified Enterococcus TaxID=2608891 RepID=UPI003F29509A
MSNKQELKNYVINSIAHKAFDPNELLRLINLLPDEPQLNDNQQIVLEWLKESYRQGWGATTIRAIYLLHKENTIEKHESSYIRKAYRKLNTFEEAIVVKLFAEWVLEQEAE